VNKKLVFFTGTILVLIFFYNYLSPTQEIDVVPNIINENITNDESQLSQDSIKNNQVIVKQSINVKNNYQSISDCGFSMDMFLDKIERINLESLDENTRQEVNSHIDICDKWFSDLQELSQVELNKLEMDFKKKKKLITQFFSFKFDKDIILESRKEIYNTDNDIKMFALTYLLRFDFKFADEVAKNMNVSSISHLISKHNVHLETLYACQHGQDCSSDSAMMIEYCKVVDSACGVSFSTWLISGEITVNLYNDMLSAIVAIDNVLNSDWFIENPLD
jgi:hypothetical protein